MLRPTLLRFLVWLIWCYAARRSLFHKSYRRSCYASGLHSKAEGELFNLCTPATRTTQNRVGNKLPTSPTTDTFLMFKQSRAIYWFAN
ncbi:hypothetical protein EDD22DRAFT_900969 [Suillus occidentalis]|nr:hypothetical protein EDD22DRAFT_900969 [Suillus occidentalis]